MKYIYNSAIAEAAQTDERDQLGKQLAEAGILDEDNTVVESLSSQAADLTLAGQYRWGEEISEMLATELDELSDSSLPALPLYRRGGGYSNAGYYEIESADIEPLHANDRSVWSFTLSLTSAGKKGSYYRAVEPNPYQADHEFGNETVGLVGVPASATKVQWFHPEDKTRAPATPLEERVTAAADVAMYDLTDASWYDPPPFDEGTPPTLIYKVDYADEVPCGVRAYDTRGYDSKFTDEGIRQWQTIHSTEHDIEQSVVLSNALLRLRLDEDAGSLTAEEWRPDGTKLYEVGNGDDMIYQYDVSTPFDITTASPTDSISTQDSSPEGMAWRPDGTQLYEVGAGDDMIYQYDVSTPFDITTASFTDSISTQDGSPRGIAWRPDGTQLYEVEGIGDMIYQYDVSTPFDITTASFTDSINAQNNTPNGIAWRPDGTQLYEVGAALDTIYQYDVSTPFDITTASLTDSIDAQDSSDPEGMAWRPDGTQLYEVGAGDGMIYQYDVSTPFDITTASLTDSIDTQDSIDPVGIAWRVTNSSPWTTTLAAADQPSTVTLFDVDITEVGMVRDRAQLTFDVDGSLFSLDAILARGGDAVLFTIPDGESGPIPTAIEDWLSPVASTTLVDPNASKGLVGRSEVSR